MNLIKQKNIVINLCISYLDSISKNILYSLNYFNKNTLEKESKIIKNLIDENFIRHWEYIFPLLQKYEIQEIQRLGDIHQQGKSTILIKTPDEKFIIKPVPTELISIKNSILFILNSTKNFEFHILQMLLEEKGYSKIEYLYDSICIDTNKFSYHYGALIFVLVLLRGVDFHAENILCTCSTPVVVDCESLFYPILLNTKKYDIKATQLLSNQSSSIQKKISLSWDYVKAGIEKAYEAIKNHKHQILDITLKSDKIRKRMIFKPTQYYYSLLRNSSHPSLLINVKSRVNYLRKSLQGHRDISQAIIQSEIEDLLNFEIPYFYFENNELYNSKKIRIKQNFLLSSKETIINNIHNLANFKIELLNQIEMP